MDNILAILAGFTTLLSMGGIGGTVIAFKRVGVLKAKTEAEIDKIKQDALISTIKELTTQRQFSEKDREDCEAEKDALRDKYEKRIEDLLDERDLFRTRILALKTLIVEKNITIPDGL